MLRRWLLLAALTACAPKNTEVVDPAPWQTEAGLEETRLALAAQMLQTDRPEQALALITLAEADGAEGWEVDLLRGRALYLQELYNKAEELLSAATEAAPREAAAWYALGLLYADTERPDAAIACFREATDHDAQHAAAWNNLGYLLYTVRNDPESIPALEKAVALDGANARYRRNLAFALFEYGDRDAAERAFRAADRPADAWYNLGLAHERLDELEAARDRYAETLHLDPEHDRARDALERLALDDTSQEAP
jgi:tetratricopeptide (TPR) repeat protein